MIDKPTDNEQTFIDPEQQLPYTILSLSLSSISSSWKHIMTKENADKDGGKFLRRKEDSEPNRKEWKVWRNDREKEGGRGQSGGNKREK